MTAQTAKENLVAAFQDWDRSEDFEEGGGTDDDPDEKFENLKQRHMMQNPEAMAFHVARKTTLHRRAQAPLQAQYQDEKGRGSMARKKECETLRNFGQRA